jgi:hypothetical protein
LSLKAEIITRDFNRMLEELAAIDPKIEFRDVVIGAAERVVRGALRATKAAQADRIRETYNEKEYTTFNGKRYKLANRYPDPLWNKIELMRSDRLRVKLAARGLSKKSWQHVAASFGRSAGGPGYVTAANYKGREYSQNGASKESGTGNNYALEILNHSPIVQAAGGHGALLRAMRGETRYFEMNMEKRAFATFESRAKKYPQIFMRRGA